MRLRTRICLYIAALVAILAGHCRQSRPHMDCDIAPCFEMCEFYNP